MKWNFDDWFVAVHVNAAWMAATVFVYHHPDPVNFATWATFSATAVGVYHWLIIRDSKEKDSSE